MNKNLRDYMLKGTKQDAKKAKKMMTSLSTFAKKRENKKLKQKNPAMRY